MDSGSQLQVAELAQMCPETPSGTQMVLNSAEQSPRTEGQDIFAAIAFSNVQLMFRFSLACIT